MNTRKSEWRTVVRWTALVIQVLIVLKGVEGQQTPSSLLASLSVFPSLLTSSSAVQATTTEATSATPSSSLLGQTPATATPLPSPSLLGQTTATATSSPSSSLLGQTLLLSSLLGQTPATATPLPSSSLLGQTSATATSLPSPSLPGQTTATATTPLSSSSPTVQSSVPPTDKVPMSPSPSKSVSSSASSTASPSSSPNVENATVTPSIYIQMSLSMPWGRFCYLTTLFKESLSRDLIEFKGLHYQQMPVDRIQYYNVDKKCKNRTLYHNKKAIVKFFISKTKQFVSENDTDDDMTITAFKLLYGYWVNQRMILLDKTFEGKVRKVQLINSTDNEDITSEHVDKYTEAQRIGIAIGVALLIVLLILIIVFCLKGRRAVRNFGRKPEDEKMVFTNAHALEERPTNEYCYASQPLESHAQPPDEPEEVVVHTQPSSLPIKESEPVSTAHYETLLPSEVKDYEDLKKADESKCAFNSLESHAQPRDEPEEVVVHTQPSPLPIKESEPVSTAHYETLLLSAVKDYEHLKKADETKTDKEPGEEQAPLAKPEPEEVSEEEPSKPPRSDSLIVVDTATTEETSPTSETPVTEEPAKTEDEPAKTEDEPAKTEDQPDEPEEEGLGERRSTFTSSVTINITPEPSTDSKGFNYPVTVQLLEPEKDENQQGPAAADEVSGKEDEKPDFGQSDSSDADPNQGAINLGFDIKDEASKEETEEEEETKF